MNRRILSIGIACVLAIAVVITVVVSVTKGSGGGDVADVDPGDCTQFTVVASSEKASIMAQEAREFNQSRTQVNGKCVYANVKTQASGAAEAALARGWNPSVDGPAPTAWSPASSTWLKILESDQRKTDKPSVIKTGGEYDPVSIIKTPLVLAMPEPAARALGWPDKPVGWKTIAALASDPRGWASVGHPEWGKFTIGKTSPDLSTSGLAATVGAFVAATGKASDLTAADLKNPKVLATVSAVENAAVHYGDTTLTFLTNLQRADDRGKGRTYVSAVAVEEKSVFDYNSGNPSGSLDTVGKHAPPQVKLVAVYPSEGTLYSDNPFIILNAPWVSADQQAGALAFRNYLLTSEAQTQFTNAGFRTKDGAAGSALSGNAFAQTVPVPALTPPDGDMLAAVRSTWRDVRKKARVLLVMDVSGSMGSKGTSASKLDEARTAAIQALTQLNPQDEVGLAIFTTDLPNGADFQNLVPIGPASQTSDKIKKSLEGLQPLNATPLYTAVDTAAKQVRDTVNKDRINAVVILTDGKNEDVNNDLDRLLGQLAVTAGTESSGSAVRVFTIAYGPDADLATLQKISEATGAKAYDARKPGTINDVFISVISNF